MPRPLVLSTCLFCLAACQAQADVIDRYSQLQSQWVGIVDGFVKRSSESGDTDFADRLRQRWQRSDSDVLSLPILDSTGAGGGEKGGSALEAEFRAASRKHGAELFALAADVFKQGNISLAYDLIRAVVDFDPDHGRARAMLGFTRYQDQWVTPYSAQQLRRGLIWHKRFGWIPKTHLEHYEKGEQFWRGRWIDRNEVARFRKTWGNAWKIETEHYTIRTNTSLELGVAFATRLEKLYAIFFRLYAGFFTPQDQLALLFDSRRGPTKVRNRRKNHHRFHVNFYRTEQEYIKALRPHVRGSVAGTAGMYVPKTKTAYFFVQKNMIMSTVVHEATHQLFSETREHNNTHGTVGNYWVVEGIACYMESLADRGDTVELGDWKTPRLKTGLQRILAGNYVPLNRLVPMEMRDFGGSQVYSLYSQSACLCHFLIHHDGGKYREQLIRYLAAVYLGDANPQTLSNILGVDLDELEKEFLRHIKLAAGS